MNWSKISLMVHPYIQSFAKRQNKCWQKIKQKTTSSKTIKHRKKSKRYERKEDVGALAVSMVHPYIQSFAKRQNKYCQKTKTKNTSSKTIKYRKKSERYERKGDVGALAVSNPFPRLTSTPVPTGFDPPYQMKKVGPTNKVISRESVLPKWIGANIFDGAPLYRIFRKKG